ncbi:MULTISPECIES: HupE/UreJ family protein [Rufibacter]|uniref:ABC-type antimicrobial peptide transport system permease subunit n=1 Tax=Rufibacter quisquiliarum TaxID=1549639 RepID=A0A839GLM1_9BACT|nr:MULTISPECIES: HupE/UreJ family protein [Rufibacter]MBA9079600.1 ABC-type antimicrobial peptide transport system permease subunit [Rufibacter quisquiliarum]
MSTVPVYPLILLSVSSVFYTYLQLGFHHIFNLQAYDHMVFVLAMCAVYSGSEWRRILALVTSFTVGHSITLALSTLEMLTFNTALIELLIPVTILITCLYNFTQLNKGKKKGGALWSWNNVFAIAFGLIHGMGFSNYLKSLLGKGQNIVLELFAFNVGIELGQLLIVALVLLINLLLTHILHVKKRDWILGVSSAAGAIALMLILGQDLSAVF